MTHRNSNPTWVWGPLNHAQVSDLILHHLPEGRPSDLKELGQGDFCLAFSWEDRVVRVARHHDAAEALRREACGLGRIGTRLPVTVPRPTFHAPEGCPPFAVHDAVVGDVLTRESWMDMPTAARKQIAMQLAEFLSALHACPIEIGFECGLPRLDSMELARRLRQSAARTIVPALSTQTRAQLERVLAEWSEGSQGEGQQALLHCDIAPGHLLFDAINGNLTGVIDFGDLAIGHPARDFIFVYEDYGSSLLTDVVEAYRSANVPSLLADIRKWYLLEAVDWTVQRWIDGASTEAQHGLREITRVLSSDGA